MFKKSILALIRNFATRSNYLFVLKNFKPLLELKHINSLLESKRFFQLIETIEVDSPKNKKITVIAPHTDDDIFGAGGTLIKAASKGANISVIYLSNSSKTSFQAKLVKQEARDICNNYGANPYFLDLVPGNIGINNSTTKILRKLLVELSPETLFISFFLDDNDDHRRANQLFINSISGIDLQTVEVWAYQIYSTLIGNVVVDITNTIDRKILLMNMWKNVEGKRNWVHYILGINMMNCRYLNKKGKVYGEVFFVIPAEEYIDLCKDYFSVSKSNIYHNLRYLS
jgi:N-acetylglucosamine malate deacetylase 1